MIFVAEVFELVEKGVDVTQTRFFRKNMSHFFNWQKIFVEVQVVHREAKVKAESKIIFDFWREADGAVVMNYTVRIARI